MVLFEFKLAKMLLFFRYPLKSFSRPIHQIITCFLKLFTDIFQQEHKDRAQQTQFFYQANFNMSQNHLWEHCCLARCVFLSVFHSSAKCSRSACICREQRLMEDLKYFTAGCFAHKVQCSSSFLGTSGITLTPPLHRKTPLIPVYFSSSMTFAHIGTR